MKFKQIKNTPVDSNCYVVYDKALGKECIVVDPGSEKNEGLLEFLLTENLTPSHIILTHEHFDHCWGIEGLRTKYPQVKLVCSAECSIAIQDKKRNHSIFYQQPGFVLQEADIKLENVFWSLKWQDRDLKFYPVKGHTSAGIIFCCGSLLFTGDELIKDIRTVTKLKTGSKEKLNDSIELLESLKGSGWLVCPGHGETFDLDSYELQKING